MTILSRWKFKVRYEFQFGAVLTFVFRSAARVKDVINQHPLVLKCRDELLWIWISGDEIEVVAQNAGLEEIDEFFREFNLTFNFSLVQL